jgi:hypothetical protein
MPLLFAGVCKQCSSEVAAKTVAFYDPTDKSVVCQACHGVDGDAEQVDPLAFLLTKPELLHAPLGGQPAFPPPVTGTAVADPHAEHRRAAHSPIARRRNQHAVDLGELLDQACQAHTFGEAAVVLHARQAPTTRGTIDHLVVAPSGVWVIDTMPHEGKVERRQVGPKQQSQTRLFVNGQDTTELVDGLTWQTNAVRAALDPVHLGDSPIHPVLVFPAAGTGWFAKPFEVGGARITWGKHLTDAIATPGPLDDAALRAITIQLNLKLVAKR